MVGAPTLITATLPDSEPIRSRQHVLVDPERGPLQLGTQLGDPELDVVGGTAAADDRGAVRVDQHLRGPAELLDGHRLQGEPRMPAVHGAAGDRGDVLELVQPPVAEAGRPHRHALEDPFTWLCTSMQRAVPSTFSAMMTSGRGARMTLSSSGISCWTLVIFSLQSRMYGSSRIASRLAGLVTRYGDR